MAANTGRLAGKTLFITGASRGIGKAIALRAAKDGANIVIAAKTATPHHKLPGTIYTAAAEVEKMGGKALPCLVDIREEADVEKAVAETVSKFGGIDILINNASAISLTGTLGTPMKKYDLMMGVNGRGTYLCSRVCIPHLKNASNPHILNISPPLNLNPKWFKGHVAYTMAKYGMSMCALGMSEELKEDGIAVNALWPRTGIYTAAMEMLGGGQEVMASCRTVDIMADAAYCMLTKDSRSYTGNFAIDDDVLRESGVTDMEQYSCVPGSDLLPDFFLDQFPEDIHKQIVDGGGKPAYGVDSGGASQGSEKSGDVAKVFGQIETLLNEDLVKSMNGVFQFNLKDSVQRKDDPIFCQLSNVNSGLVYVKAANGKVFIVKLFNPKMSTVTPEIAPEKAHQPQPLFKTTSSQNDTFDDEDEDDVDMYENRFYWTHRSTKKFIDILVDLKQKEGDLRFAKPLWRQMSEEMDGPQPSQCKEKFYGMKKSYRKYLRDCKSINASSRKQYLFEKEMNYLLEEDPEIQRLISEISHRKPECDEGIDDEGSSSDEEEANTVSPRKGDITGDITRYLQERDDKFLNALRTMHDNQIKLMEKVIDKL